MILKIEELTNFILLEEESITNKKKKTTKSIIKKEKANTQRKTIFLVQKSVFKNALNLHDKRIVIINEFANKYVIFGVKAKTKTIAERVKRED